MTSDPAYCLECGSELPPGAKFCAECGEAVSGDAAEAADGADGQETATAATDPDAGQQTAPEEDSATGGRSADDGPAAEAGPAAADHGQSATGAEATAGERAAEDRTAGDSLQGRTVLNSLIGTVIGFLAAVVLVLSAGPLYFVGVMLGSGVAGWLQRRGAGSGALVGGVAGVVSTLLFTPFAVVLVIVGLGQFVATGVPLGALPGLRGAIPETQGLLAALVGVGAVVFVVVALINLVVGAVSGAVGGAIAEG